MAAKRMGKIIALILVLAIAGAAAVLLTRSPDTEQLSPRDDRFTNVFVDMALAREMAGNDLDSLRILYGDIFDQYDVDSLWLYDYITEISGNTEKHKLIWDVIVEKLDSINNTVDQDTTTD